ncbi:MAG: 1-deoxy-D-xylulose-5-phosphate reductoisomerase [Acidimicrobiales bacterium]|nr:MAG: 1-deoxy-D-xylulose-5-phosphate reductoisomerase [Acidimicrobiales bacterium]
MTTVAVMGSTGSIGTQTLDIIRASQGRYAVDALSVGASVDALAEQVKEFRPRVVVVADPAAANTAVELIGSETTVLHGDEGLREASASADITINGVMGFAGLAVTLSTLEHGKRLGLANKESLIAAGPVVQKARQTPGAELLPVDSEHCALHQCLRATADDKSVSKLVLTASGGPFRGRSADELASVTVENALDHPTWSMGPKITIDSSTLMNKGLEVIEAHELYGIDYDDIDVVVHPQSIVHSMVAYRDGATIAQLSEPDMRLCIGYALAYPDRLDMAFGEMDWTEAATLSFEPPDRQAFPCLDLAYQAGRRGGTAPAWISATNEIAVDAFLEGLMPWTGIAEVNEELLELHDGGAAESLDAVLDADTRARAAARQKIHGSI